MTVRRALETDAPAIAEVHVGSWHAAYRGLLPDSFLAAQTVERRAGMWSRLLNDPQLDTFVAEDARGVIVGFANLAPSRDADAAAGVGELTALYVAPTHWRSGCGRALLNAVFAAACSRGFCRLTLWVLQSNTRARHFYEAAGFVFDGTEKADARSESVVLHECRYCRELAATPA